MKEVVVDGVHYKSMQAAADAIGISYATLQCRINRKTPTDKWSFRGSLREQNTSSAKPITVFGVEYKSIKDAIKETGSQIAYGTVAQRLLKGYSPELALTEPHREKISIKITVHGITYKTLKAALKASNVTFGTLVSARKAKKFEGKTDQEIIEHYVDHKNARGNHVGIIVQGVAYESILDFARSIGVLNADSTIRAIRRAQKITTSEACEQWLENFQRAANSSAKNKAAQEAKRARGKEIESKKIVWGDFSPIAKCNVCGVIHEKKGQAESAKLAWVRKTGVMVEAFCSDECKKQRKKESMKAQREKAKKEGTRCHGKHSSRARKKGVPYESGITAKAIANRDGLQCQMCGEDTIPHNGDGTWQPRGWSVGHIVPIDEYGPHIWSNVWLECVDCNSRKGNRTLPRFAFAKEELPDSKHRVRWNQYRCTEDANQLGLFATQNN